jgi:hypothetical protein
VAADASSSVGAAAGFFFLVFSKGEPFNEVLRGAGTAATGKAAKGEPSRGNAQLEGYNSLSTINFIRGEKTTISAAKKSETLATVRLLNVVNPFFTIPFTRHLGYLKDHPTDRKWER